MGLLSKLYGYDRQIEAQQASIDAANRQAAGILGAKAVGTEGQPDYVAGSGLLGGQISPLQAQSQLIALPGTRFDQQANQIGSAYQQQQQAEYTQRMNAPPMRTIQQGQQNVNQQWNPQSQAWDTVGQGAKWSPNKGGMTVYGPDGQPIMTTGGGGGGVTKPTATATEKRQIGLMDQLANLSEIDELYKPEYQEFSTQFSNMWSAGKDKLGMASPEEKNALYNYSQFRASAAGFQNDEINRLSGGAVTAQETPRLLRGIPDAGTSPGTGDSPTEFEAKYKQTQVKLRNIMIRSDLTRRLGLGAPGSIPYTTKSINRYISKYADEVDSKYRGQGMNADQAETATKAHLKEIGYIR